MDSRWQLEDGGLKVRVDTGAATPVAIARLAVERDRTDAQIRDPIETPDRLDAVAAARDSST